PLSLSTIDAFAERYKAPLLEGYGLTEASPVVSLNPIDGVRKAGSIGVPLPGISVRVVDEAGSDLTPDEIGELLVMGPNVMRGYFADEAATAKRIIDGWLFTGDMARIDTDGYIYIEDRKDDMILVQGANVYPHEVEDVIKEMPGVLEVSVVGLADTHQGARPVAVVQPAEGASLTEGDVIDYVKRRLSNYKAPRQVFFWKELPLCPLGKPLKREIRRMLGS
ncbi:AMP-binding protein, partial [bacterium]|nr:AMP-binding protein [bacterium]